MNISEHLAGRVLWISLKDSTFLSSHGMPCGNAELVLRELKKLQLNVFIPALYDGFWKTKEEEISWKLMMLKKLIKGDGYAKYKNYHCPRHGITSVYNLDEMRCKKESNLKPNVDCNHTITPHEWPGKFDSNIVIALDEGAFRKESANGCDGIENLCMELPAIKRQGNCRYDLDFWEQRWLSKICRLIYEAAQTNFIEIISEQALERGKWINL